MSKPARLIECSMYLLFALALSPLAYLEGRMLLYYFSNPAMLEVRDSALEAPAIGMAITFAFYLLVPAAVGLLYVLLTAPRAVKIHAGVLLLGFCLFLYLSYLGGEFGFHTWERLYLEAIPLLVLVLLAVVLMVRRLFSTKLAPNSAFQDGRAVERRTAERGR